MSEHLTDHQFHPAASLFAIMAVQSAEFGELIADIREHGLLEPITLHEGKILDGRNRYRACRHCGVEPKFVQWSGDSPLAFVLSRNLHRRHLTDDQRAALAAETLPMLEAEACQRRRATQFTTNRQPDSDAINTVRADSPTPSGDRHVSRRLAAEQFQVTTHKVREAATVEANDPDLAAAVRRGELRLVDARRQLLERQLAKRGQGTDPVATPPRLRVLDRAEIQAAARKRLRKAHRELVELPGLDPRSLVDHLSPHERAALSPILGRLAAWIPTVQRELASRVAPKEVCP